MTKFFFLLIFISTNLFSQHTFYYQKWIDNESLNFYQVCDSVENYYLGKDKGKGTGYKPFLRWKHDNESKFYPSGDRKIDYAMPFREFERIKSVESKKNHLKLFQTGGWQSLGPDTISMITGQYSAGLGRLEYVVVNPNDSNQIYFGSRSGGLWRTSNEGATWLHNTDFLPASGVNAIAPSPTNFDSVLINVRIASSGYSFGIYRSIDGGNSFTPTNFIPANIGLGGLGSTFSINVIKYHPRISNLVFVGTNTGIYKSTDNLQTWVRLYTGNSISDIEFHPTIDSIIYINNASFSNQVLRSKNLGTSYTTMPVLSGNSGSKLKLTVSPNYPMSIWATSSNGIWKSDDTATSFTTIVSPAPSGVSLSSVMPNINDTSKFVGGYVDNFQSVDGGRSFSQTTQWSLGTGMNGSGTFFQNFQNSTKYVHADVDYSDNVGGRFYICTDGFLSKSYDNGVTWKRLSNKVSTRENYRVGVCQSNHYVTMSGSQDNGTSIKNQSGWIEYYGADGMEAIVHPLNPDWMIGSSQYGGRVRTTDGGYTNSVINPSAQVNASWIAPLLFDPNNPMTIFSMGDTVFRSDNFGTSWAKIGNPTTFTGGIDRAAIAYNNSKLIAISKSDKIELSTNGGLNFTNIKGSLPALSIETITFDPKRDSTLYVIYSNYNNNNQKIYQSDNLGSTWTNITYNLGNMPLESVVVDHTDSSNIYVGGVVGIYKKSRNSTTWTLYNTNYPNVSTEDLEINWGSNTIKAASWGRGLWEYSIAGRNSYPAILTTSISNPPTTSMPKATIAQYVTSTINYSGSLTSVYVLWAKDTALFNSSNKITMSLQTGTTWKSISPLPDDTAGRKIFFKVYAVGSANDTTETYKFMYTIQPYVICAAAGEKQNGNLYMSRFRCANVDNNGTANDSFSYYPNKIVTIYRDSSYNVIGDFNTGWADNDFIVWIDYNNDGDFSISERVVMDMNTTNQGNGNFTVPSTAVLDTVRMRVRLGYWGDYSTACGVTLGEVEDYPALIKTLAAIPLPVTWLSFTGDATESGNHLNWQTASEKNVSHFEIQRSEDALNYQSIDSVYAIGNSVTISNYQFIDYACRSEINYYRLKQVDNDGKYTFSKTIAIAGKKSIIESVYPNPVGDKLYVELKDINEFEFNIYYQSGIKVLKGKSFIHTPIDVSKLTRGIYFLKVNNLSFKFHKL